MKLLIIEDEPELAKDMAQYLSAEEYLCMHAYTYDEALEKIEQYSYDCILLDLMLPGGNGMQILEHTRRQKRNDGILIISARQGLEDKVNGLKQGADDYLSKPFHLSELSARIFSIIRRKQFDSGNILSYNEIRIDLTARKVSIHGKSVILTRKEYELLLFFIGNKNKVLSKNVLAEHISGDMADMFDNHDFIYAHIKNLKKKLQDSGYGKYLNTLYGSGYIWEEK